MPILKKGDKYTPSNYKPVSLISCVGKVMEIVMFKYIYNLILDNRLKYKRRSGFIPNDSTVCQRIDTFNQIYKATKSTCIIACDISKAFDRVRQKGIFSKLRHCGIGGQVNSWLTQCHNMSDSASSQRKQ